MGLDTSHGCFNGPYSQFMRWREWLCEQAGLPPLLLMQGYYTKGSYLDPFTDLRAQFPATCETYDRCLPIRWDSLKEDPYLYGLLNHSDCEGTIAHVDCAPLADRLEKLLETAEERSIEVRDATVERGTYDGMIPCTKRFITGLRLAHKRKEKVSFH